MATIGQRQQMINEILKKKMRILNVLGEDVILPEQPTATGNPAPAGTNSAGNDA